MREKANAKFGEPLTLEQLLEMNGKPVWTKLLVESTGRKEGWTLIYNDDGYAAVQRWTQFPLWYKDYGETWIAYAYSPVQIDREAWKQCRECAPNCFWCQNNNEGKKTVPEVCKECKNHNNYEHDPDYRFCPECGRPLTDAAWREPEKRLSE